jgi:hypothetical protein
MKKIALAAGFALAATLAGCNESTSSAPASDGTTLTGVAAFRAGTAAALGEDSALLGEAVVDSNGSFRIRLPEGARPAFVRCDSAGHRLLGFVPRGRLHVHVDSATHAILDSLREAHRPLFTLDSATWDSLRAVRAPRWPEPPKVGPGALVRPDTAKVRPALPDTAKVSPVRPDTAKVRPALPDTAKVRPARPDSAKVRPALPDSLVRPSLPKILPDSMKVRPARPDTLSKPAVDTDA